MIDLSKLKRIGFRLIPIVVVGAIAFTAGAVIYTGTASEQAPEGEAGGAAAEEEGFWSCSM